MQSRNTQRVRWVFLLLILALIASGCGQSGKQPTRTQESKNGPMAIIDAPSPGSHKALGGTGEVKIEEHCIFLDLEDSDERLLLVWTSGTARWDASDRAVVFSAPNENITETRVHEGDRLTVGGSSLTNESNVEWLQRPNRSCGGERWIVGNFQRESSRK